MARDIPEIAIGGQHGQPMMDTKLRQKRIDSAGLNPASATAVPQFRGVDMVLPVRHEKWQRREPFQYPLTGFGTGKPLQQFLEYDARGEDHLTCFKYPAQR